MIRFLGTFLSALLLISNISLAHTFSLDSTGITKKGGKTFIIHVIDEGETLFALSRRYNVKIDELYIENPEAKSGLHIGQKIFVPLVETPDLLKDAKVHVVKPSETLYSIARMYEVSTQEIKKWNNLADNTIGVGDKLHIKKRKTQPAQSNATSVAIDTQGKKTHTVQPSETLFSLSRQYNVTVADLRKWNNLPGNEISIGQILIVSSGASGNSPAPEVEKHSSMLPGAEKTTVGTVNPPPADPNPVVAKSNVEVSKSDTSSKLYNVDESDDVKNTYENKKILENGFAEVIEGSSDTKKYLALHRTAPIGTIMQVRNEMNNQTVFVRVVGSIPDTGNNKNILIKISKKAFDRLGSVDARFPVEVSYIP